MDWRSMMDKRLIGHWDLPPGKDITLTIKKVEKLQLRVPGKDPKNKPVIWFEGADKGFAANTTNCKVIASLYGNDTTKWVGKRITLYRTTTSFGKETVDCLRVRPTAPGEDK